MKNSMMQIKKGMNFILSRIAALFLIAMTALVIYQVFTRYVIGKPSDFTEEIVRYLLVWTGFIGAAYAFNTRQHMALVFFKEKLAPPARRTLSICVNLLILAFAVLVMLIGGLQLSTSTMGALSSLLGVPRGIVYLIGPISGAFIAVGQLVNIWEDFNGIELSVEEGA